jgi:hypothetical protein
MAPQNFTPLRSIMGSTRYVSAKTIRRGSDLSILLLDLSIIDVYCKKLLLKIRGPIEYFVP